MKNCNVCNQDKPESEFYKDSSKACGLYAYCKPCFNAYQEYKRVNDPKHKKKSRARQMLRNAVALGKITKEPCQECSSEKSVGHHSDYNKPLVVLWLCKDHHEEWHKQNTPIY